MIVRCEFEKHEPVRNVTALAVMWYCCNFLSSCRTDGMIGMGECHAMPSDAACRDAVSSAGSAFGRVSSCATYCEQDECACPQVWMAQAVASAPVAGAAAVSRVACVVCGPHEARLLGYIIGGLHVFIG